jgi:hypothetical protein
MAFEERIDVHSELYDVRAAIKTQNKRIPNKDHRALEVHLASKCTKMSCFQ